MSHISEIVTTFLKSKGLRKIAGNENDASPILPLIMMDSAYQLYDKWVKPVESKHEMKRLKKEWIANYNLFNKDFLTCFNDEQTDFIIDMMDNFESYIAHDMMITFVQFSNLFIEEPIERQNVLTACMLANVLCQSAEIVWERIYARTDCNKQNKYIIVCEKMMHKWAEKYYGQGHPPVNPNDDKNITLAVDILCKRMINFLRTYIH